MDNKRKAGSSTGVGPSDGDERAPKRRRAPGPPSDYDLQQEESYESTTAYGLQFLETIRRTRDKNGRLVAKYFENLLPREGNEEYYRRIRMPISLKIIERKLHNQDFKNMTELESYFKRMVTNAKEFYPKNSEIFEDAERVRKALSNYMTKTNPAYKKIPGFSCQAAPIPETADAELDEASADHGGQDAGQEEDAEGDDDAQGDAEDAEGEEDDDDGDEEDDTPKKIVLKRRGPGRPSRGSSEPARKLGPGGRAKSDHEYAGVPYKGLNFQQAQEKIVEELIRKPDEHGDPYFLDFINLPARSNKEYFSVITSPLSLKGLQKLVRGIHGRQPATGISDFKNWASFEDKASLLWNNAHFFNEEGSLIYNLATELKETFEKELTEAKAVVQEPPQPTKIKVKMTPGQETPVTGAKKITIHVAGSRGSAGASPAPQTGQSSDSGRPGNAADTNRNGVPPRATVANAGSQPDTLTAPSTSGVQPSPSVSGAMPGMVTQQSPVSLPRSNGMMPNLTNVPNGVSPPAQGLQQASSVPQQPNGHPVAAAAAPPPPPLYDNKYRAPGRGLPDALLPSVLIRTHPGIAIDRRFRLEIPAHPKEAQQNISVHLPGIHNRLQLIPRLASFEQQGRPYRLFVTLNNQTLGRSTPLPIPDDPLPLNALVFDVPLQQGTNIINVAVIAALPKGQKLFNGAECELERMTINAHLMKAY